MMVHIARCRDQARGKHIDNLVNSGATVLFEVDARTMENDPRLIGKHFDRIIFNFPHAGFLGAETDRRVIAAHRALMISFFENVTTLLSPQGEVHVTHQTNYPYEWNLVNSGATVLFEVDARTMENDPRLIGKHFDRIIFNFPHAGFLGAETDRRVIADVGRTEL